ncbi:hypothetical protein DRW03_22870 [Corallococcus sp. H22C18031201]|uniref:DUF4388 domain-containing protein n=1 Tax=Citreicoccus inhibens TaxID=2849499 RepID=UPI000E74A518|nr:DUF4388 domain-containing protein [Citreicoccus inhibens]MBU8899731.1 DUF4388 domain-containing protein [Citreicoccus inhibens]RJS19207.1 hypothetical protein DRW03_22870 [Corallococcus sp. H22C18031201]
MAQVRKILIADPDLDSVRALSRALRTKGYQVHYAPDGSRALEVAVLRHPDLALFDEACRLLDARTFIQILRTNPRTEDIPVVLTTSSLDADRVRARDGSLRKPFNLDEVLSRIEHIFRRSEAAKDLKSEQQEIEGSLTQLSIPDLMQILGMNKRNGRLALERGAERGEISVAEGRPVNARLGRVEGEKALFRLLAWTEGNFTFTPGTSAARPRISRAMDDALLEGMRQSDEVNRLLPKLPPRHTRLLLAPDVVLPDELHPVTAQVVELLRQPRALGEVLDLAPATDMDVLGVLSTLLTKGVARPVEGDGANLGASDLLGAAEVHALRGRILRTRAPSKVATAKVFVCGSGASAARRVLARVPGLEALSADPTAVKSGFGTLGRLELSEVLRLDFCVLPPAEAARPLWRPFCAGALGALLMDVSEGAVRLARYLAWEVRVPVVVVGSEVPAALQGSPAGAVSVGEDLAEALRALLMHALNPAPTLPGVTQVQRASAS